MTQNWFTEILHADLAQQLKMDEILFEGRTEFQDAKIFANAHLGKVLTLDNVVQTTLGATRRVCRSRCSPARVPEARLRSVKRVERGQ